MSDDGKVTPPPPGGGAPDAAEMGEIAKNQAALQWEQAMAAFGKATMPAGAPYMPGNVPFNMPFPAPYMLPGLMQFGLNPFYQAAAAYGADPDAGKLDANQQQQQGGSKSENQNDGQEGTAAAAAPAATLKRRPSRAASLPQKKAKPAEEIRAVRSQSQAALALLAHAAGDIFPSSSDLQEPPPSLKTDTLPGRSQPAGHDDTGRGGSVNLLARKQSLDLSIGGDDDDYSLLNTAGLDEKELKKLRRKQSNRESARRSRLKKQDECDTLQRENRQLRTEIQQLMNDKVELTAQVAILNAKLSMTEAFGGGKEQQERPATTAEAAAMAAATVTGGWTKLPSQTVPIFQNKADNKPETEDS